MSIQIRKLQTQEEIERKTKRNSLYLSIIMISILLLSTAGYFSLQNDSSSSTSNEKVQNLGDSWLINFNGQQIRLSNSPENGQNVTLSGFATLQNYAGKIVYVASENDAEYSEVAGSIGLYAQRVQPACYGECDKNLPEKDCNDTMIIVKSFNSANSKAREGKVYEESNCVFIEGGLTALDAFLYRLFGIN